MSREHSIRLTFMFRGVRCRETIKLKPTKANLAHVSRLKARILDEIGRGEFVYARYFPWSRRAALFDPAGGVTGSRGAALLARRRPSFGREDYGQGVLGCDRGGIGASLRCNALVGVRTRGGREFGAAADRGRVRAKDDYVDPEPVAAVPGKEPKTAAGRRTMDLLRPAREALSIMRPLSQMRGAAVFVNRSGVRWSSYTSMRRIWVDALDRAGVRYRNQYQTRHTFASMMLSAGEPPGWVSAQMGHSNASITLRVYARWIPTTRHGAKAEALFGGGGDGL